MNHDDRDRFIITPHHPDRLRRPPPSPGGAADERFQQAFVWNTFRTLELVTPSFWLRRFHLRLTGEPWLVSPQLARVHVWQPLPLPPIQRIDGARPHALADVVIETEHAVWTLVAASASRDLSDSEAMAALADAGAWFAGLRQHYCGVIESPGGNHSWGAVLQTRYGRSRESARLRSATRGPAAPSLVRWGSIDAVELAAVLSECVDGSTLLPIERLLARNALEWLHRAAGDSLEPVRQSG